ncbi:hypothetical protein MPLDJ20_90078 [Mesorhizobium plurifarium]|uniref:Uncharacterized protein n=1 Tax=Mesorhizobium plurifarium TaxID=69974 RepID=A0A090FRN0_MESPL|nr:hypothetical protein MPLDJ20_90078 [Mesorhizobium plurifarium]
MRWNRWWHCTGILAGRQAACPGDGRNAHRDRHSRAEQERRPWNSCRYLRQGVQRSRILHRGKIPVLGKWDDVKDTGGSLGIMPEASFAHAGSIHHLTLICAAENQSDFGRRKSPPIRTFFRP